MPMQSRYKGNGSSEAICAPMKLIATQITQSSTAMAILVPLRDVFIVSFAFEATFESSFY
jgi:hypothetical protein